MKYIYNSFIASKIIQIIIIEGPIVLYERERHDFLVIAQLLSLSESYFQVANNGINLVFT